MPPVAVQPKTLTVQWNEAALGAIRATHPGPPMVARMLMMLHTAMFDAWAAYDRNATGVSWKTLDRRPPAEATEANRRTAVSYAAYRVLVDLFAQPAEKARFDAVMAGLGLDPSNTSRDVTTAAGVGNTAAAELLAERHQDGSNQAGNYADTSGYVPVNSPDTVVDGAHWQPLRVKDDHGGTVVQQYVAPHWGQVKPFALKTPDQVRAPAPATYGTPAFRRQVQEILEYSANLTAEQKVIAEYWADGPSSELPPGHWTLFAAWVSQRDHHTFDQDVKMFFAMTGAVFDASVACWGAKRAYDYVRPVTAVHDIFKGQKVRAWGGPGKDNTELLADDWRPYQAETVVTPPFPEYYSGHSTFSAAAAVVLQLFTHSDHFGYAYTARAGSSRVEPHEPPQDITLQWETFSDAADEAGISRRYGGIHFKDGDIAGRRAGHEIGKLAYFKALHHFNPKLHPMY